MESAAGTKELERLPRLQGQSTKALLKRSVMVTKLSEMLRDVMPLIDLVGAGSSTTSEARTVLARILGSLQAPSQTRLRHSAC